MRLPSLACSALQGDPAAAEGVTDAWRWLYAAAHLLDSVEDDELIPASLGGTGRAINSACGLIFSSELRLSALEKTLVPAAAAADIRLTFNHSLLTMCAGQEACLKPGVPNLAAAWQIADAKSGEFFSAGCYAGARLATSSIPVLAGFREFGFILGRLLQLGDDLKDLWTNEKGQSDLADGRWSLPIAYALEVLPKTEKARLRELLHAGGDAAGEEEARRLVLSSGAATYLTLEAASLRIRGKRILSDKCAPSDAREALLGLLESCGLPPQK